MGRIGAVIFDLDNVLYAEEEYIFAAYRGIAEFLSKNAVYQIRKFMIDLSAPGG